MSKMQRVEFVVVRNDDVEKYDVHDPANDIRDGESLYDYYVRLGFAPIAGGVWGS